MSVRLSVCLWLVSASNPFIGFSCNSIQKFFTQICLANTNFVRIDRHAFLRVVNKIRICRFHIYCPIWVKFSIRGLHIVLLTICGFRKNWQVEARKWTRFHSGIVKPYDVLDANNAVVLHHEYAICSHSDVSWKRLKACIVYCVTVTLSMSYVNTVLACPCSALLRANNASLSFIYRHRSLNASP